jgi:putative acetyltransferase
MKIRKILKSDNDQIKNIIKTVMPEFGAGGKGFAIHDNEVEDMYTAYSATRACYFVIEHEAKILGGGGVAPLEGGDNDTCELKKMYFLPEARGKGWGEMILKQCLEEAVMLDFKYCYLETFNTMKMAMKLYEKLGFERIKCALGNTGHFACDIFYLKKLI